MENLNIEGTTKTPQVISALEDNRLYISIKGRSIPEDAKEFYQPLMNLIESYRPNPKPNTVIDIQFEYLNTSSSKSLAIFLKRFESVTGTEKVVNWYYEKLDYDLKEAGEDFALIIDIPFNLVQISNS
jgi:SiaC family regulatory phosphoprotein